MNERYILELSLYANGSLGGTHYGAIITKAFYPNELGFVNALELTMRKVIAFESPNFVMLILIRLMLFAKPWDTQMVQRITPKKVYFS